MAWVLEHLQVLIGIAAAIAYMLNRARAEKADASEATPPQSAAEFDQAERTRQIQEEIRRKIAERRGEGPARSAAERTLERTAERVPPLVRPTEVRPVDPFGGPKPLGRLMRELQEAAQKEMDPGAEERRREEEAAAHRAVLARQEKLAEEMRELEAARVAEQKRVTEILTRKREEQVAARVRPASVGAGLTESLRDPAALRRAIVLREVLGAPVALR